MVNRLGRKGQATIYKAQNTTQQIKERTT